MTTSGYIRLSLPLLVAALLVGCSTGPGSTAPTTAPATPAQQALEAYARYWAVTDAAFAAPGSRDWTPVLEDVATGSALERATRDVRNYASFPAHTEGTATRAPVVGTATESRVGVVDCVSLGNSRLVADKTGQVLDDLAHQLPRYRFRADVVLQNGRWLVDRAEPAVNEPC